MAKKARIEPKERFQCWLTKEVKDQMRELYKTDNCSTMNEFVEKALVFYIGYISSDRSEEFISKTLLCEMQAMFSELESKDSRALFKLAVEIGVLGDLVARFVNVPFAEVEATRDYIAEQVKATNGAYDLGESMTYHYGNYKKSANKINAAYNAMHRED